MVTDTEAAATRLQRATTRLLVLIVTAALGAGVPALMAAADLAGAPAWSRWLLVVILDGGIVVMSLVAVDRRTRRELPARGWWTIVGGLVVASAAVQARHALAVTAATSVADRAVAGVVGALPPVVVLVATHAWLDMAAKPAARRGGARMARRTTATATATTAATTARPPITATTTSPTATTTDVTAAPRRRPTTASSRAVVDPTLRAEAEVLLASGSTVAATAKALGLAESTVRRWRDALTVAGRVPTDRQTGNERVFDERTA